MSLGFVIGQTSCLAAWMVFSYRPPLLRVLMGVAGVVVLAWTAAARSTSDWQQWLSFLGAQLALCATAFIATHRSGARLVEQPRLVASHAQQTTQKRWQISLLSLFGTTTVVAIILGATSWMRMPDIPQGVIAAYVFGFALIGSLSVWSAMGQDNRWWRLFVVLFLAPSMGALAVFVKGVDPWPLLSGIATFAATTAVVCGLMMRLAGYKIERRQR